MTEGKRRRLGPPGASLKSEGSDDGWDCSANPPSGGKLNSAAMAEACKILSVRARTEKELRDRLAKKGFSPADIDGVVREMIRRRYIDDVDTAHRWATGCVERRRYGVKGIALRLVRRGIDSDLADKAARSAYDAVGLEEAEVALELAEKRVSSEDFSDYDARRRAARRVAGFLSRRGFSYETVANVLRELFGDAI